MDGFAREVVDDRGTGASFGHVHYGKATPGDLRQMVDSRRPLPREASV